MSEYQYLTEPISTHDLADSSKSLETKLNTRGRAGWELVSVLHYPRLGRTQYNLVGVSQGSVAIFKRRTDPGSGQAG